MPKPVSKSILPAAIANCYLYWGANGDLDLVRHAICDSHVGEPDAVNAIEKVLIHVDRQPASLTLLWKNLTDKGFQLRGERELVSNYGEYLQLAQDGEWQHPYLRKIIAFKQVESVDEAVATIDEMVATTGGLRHTTRAALTGLKRKGHVISKTKVDDVTRYSIVKASAA